MERNKSFWWITVLCAIACNALAAPPYVNYQGLLNAANGQPLPTGNYNMEFRIYDQALGGTVVWGPFLFDGNNGAGHGPAVPVANGHFYVIIGPLDTASNSIANVFGTSNRFIEMRVNGGNPILPRQQFLSTPYAFAVSNSKYELTSDSLTVKSNNVIVFGDRSLPAVNGSIQSLSSNLTVSGAGTNANSRKITLDGDVLIAGASAAAPSLSVSGETLLSGMNNIGNASISGTLYATSLSDGTTTRAVSDLVREKPPVVITVNTNHPTNPGFWKVFPLDLAPYLNSLGGLTIRLIMQNETDPNYGLLLAEEKIALQPPGLIIGNPTDYPNKVWGRVLQIAGDHTSEWNFVLGDGGASELFNPWLWVHAYDFYPGSLHGGANAAPVQTGAERLWIWIAVHPDVSLRMVIYDR
jgi:hypothetical protein